VAGIIQFVDAISASPTVLLDLNSQISGLLVAREGIDLSPPPLRRSVVSSMLADGETQPAAAYGNRLVKLPVLLRKTTATAQATALQALAAQLNKPANILKVQLDGASAPVFFRTFRAPDYTLKMLRLLLVGSTAVDLDIPAEPFALGLRETVSGSPFTVTNNPAAGSNGLFLDVAGVKGDVPTPLHMTTSTSLVSETCLVAVRRHGIPANSVWFQQAEAMSQSTDTTTQANDATYSGAGNNFSRTTFATTATDAQRLVGSLPSNSLGSTQVVEYRGQYRMWARVKKTVSGDTITVHARINGKDFDAVTLASGTGFQWVDLGTLQLPYGQPARYDGYGTELGSGIADFRPFAARLAGTGSLDWDYFLILPADEEYASVTWPAAPFDVQVFDGPGDGVYTKSNASGVDYVVGATSTTFPDYRGQLADVAPNQTNRVFFVKLFAAVTSTTVITATYWPRYLMVAP
jgi:hypothetical protein